MRAVAGGTDICTWDKYKMHRSTFLAMFVGMRNGRSEKSRDRRRAK